MERIVLDTNVFVNLMLDTSLTEKAKLLLKKVVGGYKPTVLSNVFEETIFVLVREELKSKEGIERFYDLMDYIKREDYEGMELHRKFIDLLGELDVELLANRFDTSDFLDMLQEYRLLPNDALIAATCKFYGIRRIASFDEDFTRVDFLEIVKP